MTLWDKLMALKNALNYGEQLKNPATWKQRTVRITAVVGLLVTALPFVPAFEAMSQADLHDAAVLISNGVDGVLLLFNAYMQYATSAKVGFGNFAEGKSTLH